MQRIARMAVRPASTMVVTLVCTLAIACGGASKAPKDPPPIAKGEPSGAAYGATDGDGSASMPPPTGGSAEPSTAGGPVAKEMTDAEFDKLMNEVIGFFRDLGDGVAAAKTDCKKMASNIEGAITKHAALLSRTKSFSDDEAAARRAETWMRAHSKDVQPIFNRVAEGLKACANDADVNKAMEKLGNATPAG